MIINKLANRETLFDWQRKKTILCQASNEEGATTILETDMEIVNRSRAIAI
jgi:hypothetical protein